MPLLDRPRKSEAASSGIRHGVSRVEEPHVNRPIEGPSSRSVNRRQKIVVVGLGMVAISFMYVVSIELGIIENLED